MTSYKNLPHSQLTIRGWFFQSLKVLLCLWGLLGMTFTAEAQTQPPQRDGNCPPSCGYGGQNYYHANVNNLGLISYSWDNNAQQNLPLSSTQIAGSADLISLAVDENYEGWVTQGTALVRDNESLFLAPNINFTKLFAAMKNMGYAPSNETALQEWAETTSYAQRVAFVDEVVTNGVQGYIAQQTAIMHKMAGELFRQEMQKLSDPLYGAAELFDSSHQRVRRPIILDCEGLSAGIATMGLYGAIVFLMIPGGQAAGGIIGLIVALFIFMFWASGCDKGNGNSPPPQG